MSTAWEIISRDGVDQLTMRGLSGKIGVSRTAAYRHFKNKTDLLFAVAEKGFRQIAAAYAQITSRDDANPLLALEGLGKGYLIFAQNNPALYRLMFGPLLIGEKRPASLKQAADEAFSHLVKTVIRCQEAGCIQKGGPLAITSLLWSSMHGLASLLIDGQLRTEENPDGRPVFLTDSHGGQSKDADRIIDLTVKVLLKGLAPE